MSVSLHLGAAAATLPDSAKTPTTYTFTSTTLKLTYSADKADATILNLLNSKNDVLLCMSFSRSDDEIVLSVRPDPSAAEAPASEERPKYKSWRKKFRKMKVQFDEKLKQNNNYFKDEQKLEAIARRLRQGNEYVMLTIPQRE